jgi:hypothetical protein
LAALRRIAGLVRLGCFAPGKARERKTDHDKKIKAMLTYPMTSGRDFDEVLRLLDSLQLTARQPVATPVNGNPSDDVIIVFVGFGRAGQGEVPGRLEGAKALPADRDAGVFLAGGANDNSGHMPAPAHFCEAGPLSRSGEGEGSSASRSAFAVIRSVVPKPSVNRS